MQQQQKINFAGVSQTLCWEKEARYRKGHTTWFRWYQYNRYHLFYWYPQYTRIGKINLWWQISHEWLLRTRVHVCVEGGYSVKRGKQKLSVCKKCLLYLPGWCIHMCIPTLKHHWVYTWDVYISLMQIIPHPNTVKIGYTASHIVTQ